MKKRLHLLPRGAATPHPHHRRLMKRKGTVRRAFWSDQGAGRIPGPWRKTFHRRRVRSRPAPHRLDAIVDRGDAKQLLGQLEQGDEGGGAGVAVARRDPASTRQTLVSEEELKKGGRQDPGDQPLRPDLKTQKSEIGPRRHLDKGGAFDLNRILEFEPDFLNHVTTTTMRKRVQKPVVQRR